jgi:hypothetical protein
MVDTVLRRFDSDDWNPTVETLRRLEAIIPLDFGRIWLGGVDGFDQDKHAGEGDEGGEVLGGLLAA